VKNDIFGDAILATGFMILLSILFALIVATVELVLEKFA